MRIDKDMFELPDAKRVRRSELLSSPPSPNSSSPPPPSDTQQEQYSKQLHYDLEFVDIRNDKDVASQTQTPNAQQTQPSAAGDPTSDGADAFEFRLFSAARRAGGAHDKTTPTPSVKQPGIQRISIRSPTPLSSTGDGAFVVPYRPQSYYFADLERKAAYTDVALSGRQVLERANKSRWPGTALPWRVIHLDTTKSSSLKRVLATAPATTKTRRTRAGKKRRLALRKKYAATTAKAETEREKRTRRNREKKVKKKEREKQKKEDATKADVSINQHE